MSIEEECEHPTEQMVAYIEDGVRYHACQRCGEIWEVGHEGR
jgi:hypothetical protein